MAWLVSPVDPGVILGWSAAIYSLATAGYVLARWHRQPSHWALALGLVALAVESACVAESLRGTPGAEAVGWLRNGLLASALLPGGWLTFTLCYSRGNYREFLDRGWPLLLVALVLPVGLWWWGKADLVLEVRPAGPEGGWFARLSAPGVLLNLTVLLSAVGALMNLERTFRTAVGTMRWRIKLVVLGLGILFAARIYTSTQVFLFSGLSLWPVAIQFSALLVACLLLTISFIRTHLLDIDVYPSHAVLYGSMTVLLAGIYLFIVGVLSKLTLALGGDRAFPVKALILLLALVGLTLLALSDRVRQRLQRWVSRHFRRPLHDYRRFWTTFTQRTTSLLDQGDLCRAVASLLSETLNTLSVTVWLADEERRGLVLGASSMLSEAQSEELLAQAGDVGPLLDGLAQETQPVDIDGMKAPWADTLRRLCPDQFKKGGTRACVPLVFSGEVLGLITLADRVSGEALSPEDLDLLKCVGDQTAASLQNLRVSQRLWQSKELEAFQAMSAFFVHDLKNTASMLSLMLQNLPVHFNDPAFREDALRGIAKTVQHINDLIGRLSLLRGGLSLRRVEADLNELVQQGLKAVTDRPHLTVKPDLGSLPRFPLDPGQIQSVVTNLLLNAAEAVGPEGVIQVQTGQRHSWAVLTVRDNGAGMTPEFIRRSLFRPFQSTKKRGLGIGMFHCRLVVEAHRGRIEVESEPGKGTTFTVHLPLRETSPQ